MSGIDWNLFNIAGAYQQGAHNAIALNAQKAKLDEYYEGQRFNKGLAEYIRTKSAPYAVPGNEAPVGEAMTEPYTPEMVTPKVNPYQLAEEYAIQSGKGQEALGFSEMGRKAAADERAQMTGFADVLSKVKSVGGKELVKAIMPVLSDYFPKIAKGFDPDKLGGDDDFLEYDISDNDGKYVGTAVYHPGTKQFRVLQAKQKSGGGTARSFKIETAEMDKDGNPTPGKASKFILRADEDGNITREYFGPASPPAKGSGRGGGSGDGSTAFIRNVEYMKGKFSKWMPPAEAERLALAIANKQVRVSREEFRKNLTMKIGGMDPTMVPLKDKKEAIEGIMEIMDSTGAFTDTTPGPKKPEEKKSLDSIFGTMKK